MYIFKELQGVTRLRSASPLTFSIAEKRMVSIMWNVSSGVSYRKWFTSVQSDRPYSQEKRCFTTPAIFSAICRQVPNGRNVSRSCGCFCKVRRTVFPFFSSCRLSENFLLLASEIQVVVTRRLFPRLFLQSRKIKMPVSGSFKLH